MSRSSRFAWKTCPVAPVENQIRGDKYRFTVLTPYLIRLEYDPSGIFEDRASQSIFYRNFPVCDFTTSYEKNRLILSTQALTLHYDMEASFTEESLQIQLSCEPGSTWRFGEDFEDLGGTFKTLDETNGAIPLERGLCSRNGFSVLDDSDSLLLSDDGWFTVRHENTRDLYFFGYGYNYINCIQDFYRLTGAPPLLPAYALGNWWSRYFAYTADDYLTLMDRFHQEDLPFSIGVVDMDWHVTQVSEDIDTPISTGSNYTPSRGWTGYTWNQDYFPDYKAFLKGLKERGIKTSLNLHPHAGVRAHEEMYPQMAEACGIDPASKKRIPLDILSPEFMAHYFDILHHPYEEDGVDFWWMDWQQGTDYWWIHDANKPGEYQQPLERMDPLWMLNHLHIMDISRTGKRPMFFSRYSGPGSHRYPVGFSGDTASTWRSLDFQPYFTACASNIGYSFWSHDIGGHYGGGRDDELYIRWLQLGVFSPINRLHSGKDIFRNKEPWCYPKREAEILSRWLRLRHALFPYLYTMNFRNHTDLLPMIQPMYYSHPKCSDAYNVPNQYWFGSELIVAPITQPMDSYTGLGSTKAWLPKGHWFDFTSGLHYTSRRGRMITTCRPLDEMPIFAKAGAIVPMARYQAQQNTLSPAETMDVLVFPGADNHFNMYEDGGDYSDYQNGAFVQTSMDLSWGEQSIFTIHPAAGDLSLIPEKRTWRIALRGFHHDIRIRLFIDNAEVSAETTWEGNTLWLTVHASVTSEIRVDITGDTLLHDNREAMDLCWNLVQAGQFSYLHKNQLWTILQQKNYPMKKNLNALKLNNFPNMQTLVEAIVELMTLNDE